MEDWTDFGFGAGLVIVILAVIGVFGAGVWMVESNKHELNIACIDAGKSLIEGNCVKVVP